MVLFLPIQQELDCISGSGHMLGRIKFDGATEAHIFCPANESIELSNQENP